MSELQILTSGNAVRGIVDQVLSTGSTVSFSVTSASMAPSLIPGDRIVVRRTTYELVGPGDVVLQQIAEVRRVHRVIGRCSGGGKRLLITKGDNSQRTDEPAEIDRDTCLVLAVERNGVKIDLRTNRVVWLSRYIASISRLHAKATQSTFGLAGLLASKCLRGALRFVTFLAYSKRTT